MWSRRPGAGVKSRGIFHEATVTIKPVTGESTKETVKTIAQGRPGVPVNLWSTTVCFLPFAHGAMGAAGTRFSLRPSWDRTAPSLEGRLLPSWGSTAPSLRKGGTLMAKLALDLRRERGGASSWIILFAELPYTNLSRAIR